jgi:uncharacterized tellurite resistance protein B-like protein
MFLSELLDKEKKVFLGLAFLAMKSDGNISPDEMRVFNTYKHECQLPEYQYKDENLDELLKDLKHSTKKSKRIVLMELMGIWIADNIWEDEEIEMMYHIGESLGLSESETTRLKRWAREMRDIVFDGYELLMRE